MSDLFYLELLDEARVLIGEFGRTVTLRQFADTPANPAKPWGPKNEGLNVDTTFRAVFIPPNQVRQFGLSSLGEGTEMRELVDFSEQIVILCPGETIDVRNVAIVVDRGVEWGVRGTQVLRPGNVTLLAYLGVRR